MRAVSAIVVVTALMHCAPPAPKTPVGPTESRPSSPPPAPVQSIARDPRVEMFAGAFATRIDAVWGWNVLATHSVPAVYSVTPPGYGGPPDEPDAEGRTMTVASLWQFAPQRKELEHAVVAFGPLRETEGQVAMRVDVAARGVTFEPGNCPSVLARLGMKREEVVPNESFERRMVRKTCSLVGWGWSSDGRRPDLASAYCPSGGGVMCPTPVPLPAPAADPYQGFIDALGVDVFSGLRTPIRMRDAWRPIDADPGVVFGVLETNNPSAPAIQFRPAPDPSAKIELTMSMIYRASSREVTLAWVGPTSVSENGEPIVALRIVPNGLSLAMQAEPSAACSPPASRYAARLCEMQGTYTFDGRAFQQKREPPPPPPPPPRRR